MAKEEWGVDEYGSMKGLIRLRPGAGDSEEADDGSRESDAEEPASATKIQVSSLPATKIQYALILSDDGRRGEDGPHSCPTGPAASGRKHPRDAPAASDLKRVAEIVMVLSGLGEMRAGQEPSAAEKALAVEVNGLLVGVCEGLNPKDLFPRDAVRGVVEEFGLNRLMDPSQAGRPAKMSIADKLQLTKKRMEEKKDFATLHPSQPQGSMFPGAPPRFLPPTSVASHYRMDAQYKGLAY